MYIVKKIDNETNDVWNLIEGIKVDNFFWDETGYKPETEVKMYYTEEYLKVRFVSHEKEVRVHYTNFNEDVYKDSCVEFFLMPNPEEDKRYINFETSAAGVLLLQIDEKTSDRTYIREINPDIFEMKTSITKENAHEFNDFKPWCVEYKIPFSFVKTYFKDFKGVSGHIMKGNFYKCGDDTLVPHYGSWNKIVNDVPKFHRPEFFGELVLE